MKTKTDQVRELLGLLTPREIADQLGMTLQRVHTIRWRDQRKAKDGTSYAAMKMRELRARDPGYYQRELNQQGSYRRRIMRDPEKRARRNLTRRLSKIARGEILARIRI